MLFKKFSSKLYVSNRFIFLFCSKRFCVLLAFTIHLLYIRNNLTVHKPLTHHVVLPCEFPWKRGEIFLVHNSYFKSFLLFFFTFENCFVHTIYMQTYTFERETL